MRILAWSVPFLYLGYVLVNVLVSSDQTKLAALATGGAAAMSIAANLLLIPLLGIAGSALAALAAQATLVVIGAVGVERAVTRSRWIPLASRPVLAGAAMVSAVALIGPASWAVAFPAGLMMYVLVLVLGGALREEEVLAVRRLWRGAKLSRVLAP
jgi:O-antigen/teichoic acid export membrane protein